MQNCVSVSVDSQCYFNGVKTSQPTGMFRRDMDGHRMMQKVCGWEQKEHKMIQKEPESAMKVRGGLWKACKSGICHGIKILSAV